MVGLYGAVTRKGKSGRVYGPDEAVDITTALRGYTRNGAFLTREEGIKGTLVDLTALGGRILYRRQETAR